MFTGLIEDIGRVLEVAGNGEDGRDLVITPGRIQVAELALGDSIAVNGVCLTVTTRGDGAFRVTVGPESLARTTLRTLEPGARVNLERALRASDRLGGHIVAGHVDVVATISALRPRAPGLDVSVAAPREILRYVVEKGSVALDGISLTVNRVDESSFTVGLIPHTMEATTLAGARIGTSINLEVDLIGKYVEKLLGGHGKRPWPTER